MQNDLEILRKEYEGLNLTDEQIVQLKSIELLKDQFKQVVEIFKLTIIPAFKNVSEFITKLSQAFYENEELKKNIRMIYIKSLLERKQRDKKGKALRPWQKKKFYQ